jgi:xylulokinase
MNEPEACATGMWVHGTSSSPGHWDEGVLEIVGGTREEGRRIRAWLGDVDLSGGSRKIGMISRYLVDRYRFDHGEWFA